MSGLHVVIGAGGLGRSVAEHLVSGGERVRLVSRTGDARVTGAESVGADATNPSDLDVALAGASVVYQCAAGPHAVGAGVSAVADRHPRRGRRAAGADLVIADNLYMYGDPNGAVITEASPENPATRKGRVRKTMVWMPRCKPTARADCVWRSRVPPTTSGRGTTSRARRSSATPRGRAMQFFGRGMDAPHTLSYLPDAAGNGRARHDRGRVGLGLDPTGAARGHAAGARRARVGGRGQLRSAEGARHRSGCDSVGRSEVPVVREFAEMSYQYEEAFVVDSSRFESTFGAAPTATDVAIAATVEHYRGELGRGLRERVEAANGTTPSAAAASSGSRVTKASGLQLRDGDVLGAGRVIPPQLLGNAPGRRSRDPVAEQTDAHGRDPVEDAAGLFRSLVPLPHCAIEHGHRVGRQTCSARPACAGMAHRHALAGDADRGQGVDAEAGHGSSIGSTVTVSTATGTVTSRVRASRGRSRAPRRGLVGAVGQAGRLAHEHLLAGESGSSIALNENLSMRIDVGDLRRMVWAHFRAVFSSSAWGTTALMAPIS